MSTQPSTPGASYHSDSGAHQGESITMGVGGPTSGEAGSTPAANLDPRLRGGDVTSFRVGDV